MPGAKAPEPEYVGWLAIPADPGRTNQPRYVVRLVPVRMELDRQFPLEARPLESLLREALLFARAGVAAQTPTLARARLEDVGDDVSHEPCALQGSGNETVSPLQIVAEVSLSARQLLTV
jgi:hypothetical protein